MNKKRLRHNELKKISKECYDLDHSFIKWLNIRLKVYLKDASKFVDLTYHRFFFQGEEWTLEDLIKRMIRLTDDLLDGFDDFVEEEAATDELLDIWHLVFKCLWW